MRYELCRHIKTNGIRCHSPALTGQLWCFFHARLTSREREIRTARPKPKPGLTLPTLIDREACQVSISLIAAAILNGSIDNKRATLLLRAIHLASRNIGPSNGLMTEPYAPSVVRSYTPTLDGLTLAPRSMSDNSAPPALDAPPEPLQPELEPAKDQIPTP